MKNIIVWDLPLRIFHWSLVILFVVAIVTAKLGGNALEWHSRAGLAILALLIFRILWGFAGTAHARFVNFVRGPKTILAYVQGRAGNSVGHNPLGALSVIAMLISLLFQAISGLFANDDILTEGPLYALVDKDTSDYLTSLHTANQYVLYGLLALHLGAIVYYHLRKKERLVQAMITGRKQIAHALADNLPSISGYGHVALATVLLSASGAGVWVMATHWA